MYEQDKTCQDIKKKTKCKNLNRSIQINHIKHTKPSSMLSKTKNSQWSRHYVAHGRMV